MEVSNQQKVLQIYTDTAESLGLWRKVNNFLLLQGNMFTEMNYLHENQSDSAKYFSTLLMIFSYSIKNKCSMTSSSRWDVCETGSAQNNIEEEYE